MRALGINVQETAIMSAVTPAVVILMPPMAGMIADKIGNFRVLLASFSAIGGASALLLLLVPVGRLTITFPDRLVFGLSCDTNSTPALSLYQEYPCTTIDPDRILDTELKVESCGFACQAILSENYTNQIIRTRSYDVKIYDIQKNSTLTYTHKLSEGDLIEPEPITKAKNQKTLKNNERYRTSIRKLSKNFFYFPTISMYNFSCDMSDEASLSCVLGSRDQFDGFQRIQSPWKAGIKQKIIEHIDFEENRQIFEIDYINNKNRTNISCLQNTAMVGKHISVTIPINSTDTTVKHLDLGSCVHRCLATSPRKNVCSNSKTVIELDMTVTFWSYLSVRVFVGIISGTSFAMFEGAVIAILRQHKADYGLQRIYATIGGMISSPLSGWLIDYASQGKGYTDFRPIFFLYAGLKLVSGFLMLFINLEFKKAASSVITDVITVLKKLELIALFLSCIVLGCAWGFIESFLFWLIDDLGGSKSLMGLTVTIGGIVGIPLLVLSGPIVKKIGHANVIFIGFVFYAIRLLGYSLIYNPWLCLVFEAMESITFGLSFTAAVTYAAKLSTVTTDTSIQGMLGGLYYGVGKGVGSLVGGYLIEPIGIRSTFQLFSVTTALIGMIYFSFYHIYMKKHPSEGTDITKKDKVKTPEIPNNIDQKTKSEIANIQADLPMVYEDALCNPAYETTEVEDEEGDAKNNYPMTKINGQI
nr:major facilitator superfamily domain-containing protein 6-like [Leptinotarsa decemlineata]